MRYLRGLHDIKTHGSLAREGQLIGVARNLHKSENCKNRDRDTSDDWSIERHVYPPRMIRSKKNQTRSHVMNGASIHRELFLKNKTRLYQIGVIQDFLQEMRQAIAEGIPVAMQEFERLTKRLAELEAG